MPFFCHRQRCPVHSFIPVDTINMVNCPADCVQECRAAAYIILIFISSIIVKVCRKSLRSMHMTIGHPSDRLCFLPCLLIAAISRMHPEAFGIHYSHHFPDTSMQHWIHHPVVQINHYMKHQSAALLHGYSVQNISDPVYGTGTYRALADSHHYDTD